MLLGNNSPGRQDKASVVHEDFIIRLLDNGQYAEAYLLLKKNPEGKVSTLYNLALCCFFAGSHAQALIRLDEALVALRTVSLENSLVEDSTYQSLLVLQNTTACYQLGVTEEYVLQFASMMKDTILRLKIDCYLTLKQWNKIIETAASLKAKNYQNVVDALAMAENSQNKS